MKTLIVNASEAVDRRVLLAERDAARRERTLKAARADLAKAELKLLHSELEAAEYLRQIGRLEATLALLYESASWRWSAPVRRVSNLLERLRAAMGGPPPTVLPGPAPPEEPRDEPPEAVSLRERAILQRLQRPR